LSKPESRETSESRFAVTSVESALLELELVSGMPRPVAGADPEEYSFVTEPEPKDPGFDVASPSILLMPNASLSNLGLLPKDKDEEGDGSGCDPVMNIDSGRGVWLPPRPLEGGTPINREGGGVALEEAVISASMIDSTSSMQMSTFSGFKSG
jgi:hypothetical protein